MRHEATLLDARVRPSGQTEADPKDSGDEVVTTVTDRSDRWYVLAYVLCAVATVLAAAWTLGAGPGAAAAALVLAAVGNTITAVMGIRLVRS